MPIFHHSYVVEQGWLISAAISTEEDHRSVVKVMSEKTKSLVEPSARMKYT